MAHAETYDLSRSATLLNRLTVSVASQAYYIVTTEPPETANHTARLAWAKTALRSTRWMAETMALGVCGNPTVAAAGEGATDAELDYVVNVLAYAYAEI